MTLIPVAKIKVKPITPLWIGGYKAATYSPELGLVEPIRPYEIKGALRWMVRNLVFLALNDLLKEDSKVSGWRVIEAKAIRLVEKILGQAAGDRGGASLYVLRIETPEGGVIYPDYSMSPEMPRDWPKYQQAILEQYVNLHDRCLRREIYSGFGILLVSYSPEKTPKGANILLPLPYIDINPTKIRETPGITHIDREIEHELLHIFKLIMDRIKDMPYSMQHQYEELLELIQNNYNVVKINRFTLGGLIRRYQLEIVEGHYTRLISIGNPRTILNMLGEEGSIGKAAKIFMIPLTYEIVIGVYRRPKHRLINILRDENKEIISRLDRIIIKSLQLSLILKGIGKATNRGYGSFEILDIKLEGDADNIDLKPIKEIPTEDYLLKEIEDIKEDIKELIKIMERDQQDKADQQKVDSGTGSDPYVSFVENSYKIFLISPVIDKERLPYTIDLINNLVLSKTLEQASIQNKDCICYLGLPRYRDRNKEKDKCYIMENLLKIPNKRMPSLIRFRIVRYSETKYRVLMLNLYPKETIIKSHIESCIEDIHKKIRDYICEGVISENDWT